MDTYSDYRKIIAAGIHPLKPSRRGGETNQKQTDNSTMSYFGPASTGGGGGGGGSALDLAKIFVGGLSWQTTEETLRYHFEQFGEVASVEVMRDRGTGNPRGFAFVVFKSDETVELVLKNMPHEVNHKVVDVKRAQARGAAPPSIHRGGDAGTAGNAGGGGVGGSGFSNSSAEELQNKVFVGGLPLHVDSDALREFFSQFGRVVDAIVMIDQVSQRSRGFGFVTWEDGCGGAQKAIAEQPVSFDGKSVEVKLATPKGGRDSGGGGGDGHRPRPGQFGGAVLGLRAGAAAAASQSTGEFAGLAAAYGRNGWRAGYGTYAFGRAGWAVRDWEDTSEPPERSGFSFDFVGAAAKGGGGDGRASGGQRRVVGADEHVRDAKRQRH